LTAKYDPLVAPPPEEVPLPNAPLVRVIAQVQFPPILAVEKKDFVAPFQEEIRREYPRLRREQAQSLHFGPDSIAPGETRIAWRFTNADDTWRVSLTSEFVALETTAYSSRSDFVARVKKVLQAVARHLEPAGIDRVGLRYIDRVVGPELQEIKNLVRPDILGIVLTPLFEHARLELSETLLKVPDADAELRTRWGHLPEGLSVDPNAIEPVQEKSWILDLDQFSNRQDDFSTDALGVRLQAFAERIYTMFRWAVTDEFLRRFGGTP